MTSDAYVYVIKKRILPTVKINKPISKVGILNPSWKISKRMKTISMIINLAKSSLFLSSIFTNIMGKIKIAMS